jgi:RNA polymerase sigma-70 factor (ECF subfamily)
VAKALTERDTADLVAAAQAGDRAAFGALYERFARLVHGVLLANAQSDDVSDLGQEVFFTALRKIGTLRDRPAFGAWVSAIARNEARMHHRAHRETVEVPAELPSTGAADDRLKANEVLAAVKRLPEKYREPLLLRLVEEMGGEEIAAQLGLSHGTVRVYLHHGLAQLRTELGGRNG